MMLFTISSRFPWRNFACRAVARRKVCAGLGGLLAFSPVGLAVQMVEISMLDNGVLACVALAVLERAYARLDVT
jgi:hypothetical protein